MAIRETADTFERDSSHTSIDDYDVIGLNNEKQSNYCPPVLASDSCSGKKVIDGSEDRGQVLGTYLTRGDGFEMGSYFGFFGTISPRIEERDDPEALVSRSAWHRDRREIEKVIDRVAREGKHRVAAIERIGRCRSYRAEALKKVPFREIDRNELRMID
ncbi:hypothetical protein SISNIDRAFT_464761 [Sistotremastrum niveocremeum HHB9708]|uniref:Uncharacterized protein n=1 Tax=Sistotremastrum niveocremeum HHB9708 TaxID=1314777 RepID=A0A164WJM4_9AGAM|nr:hypothetical protein SISNIDRAFT_464761 [Sistotremastrum niveocremeum HHB9708]